MCGAGEACKSDNAVPAIGTRKTFSEKWFRVGAGLLFLIITSLIYSNAVNAPFHLDDGWSIVENPHIRLTDLTWQGIRDAAFQSPAEQRPIPNITFALNYYVHQYDVTGYHLVNIVIHIINGILLFFFIRITLLLSAHLKTLNSKSGTRYSKLETAIPQAELLAFAAALIWLVHPLCTQSVTYIVQRMNSMAALFYLLSFLCYIKGRLSERQVSKILFFTGSLCAGIAALASKQIAVTLPFFILLYEWYFLQDLDAAWLRKRVVPLACILLFLALAAVLYMGVHPLDSILSGYRSREFTLSQRVMTEFRVVLLYLSLLFYPNPARLNLDYDFPLSYSLINPPTTLLSLGVIAGLLVPAILFAKRERLLSFCILWFFGNLVLESSVIGLELVFEHRTYLPSMLAVLAAVLLVQRHLRYRWLQIALLCLTVALFSLWTYERNGLWADEQAFWEDVVRKSPGKSRPHNNLGNIYTARGELEKARSHYAKAVQFEPRNEKAWFNMGNTLLHLGELDEAIRYYEIVLKINPRHFDACNNLGTIYFKKGDYPAAADYFNKSLAINPDYAEVQYNLAATLEKQGLAKEALSHYREALRIRPDYEAAQEKHSTLTEKLDTLEDAINKVKKGLESDPENPAFYSLLGDLYGREGDFEQSISYYLRALEFKPDSTKTMNSLAMVHAAQGEYDEALRLLRGIIEIRPDLPEAYYNIACILARMGNIEESLEWLRKSIERGFDDIKLMENDSDLAKVRGTKGYREIVNSLQ